MEHILVSTVTSTIVRRTYLELGSVSAAELDMYQRGDNIMFVSDYNIYVL